MIAKEIEREGIPVAFITAMAMVGKQTKASRVIAGVKVPNPCGDPRLPAEADRILRRGIVDCALGTLQTDVCEPTVFEPDVEYTIG